MNILICGTGGFIGGHFVKYWLKNYPNDTIFATDIKPISEWFQVTENSKVINFDKDDLRNYDLCNNICKNCEIDWVFQLACDRGGIKYIVERQVEAIDSVLINTNMLKAAHANKVKRYFFSSSVCVYSPNAQMNKEEILNKPIKEDEVWNLGRPNESYGIEKLFSEEACNAYHQQYGLETRIARFNTVYGSHENVGGDREKAPAALCRKILEAKKSGKKELEIWGTGKQMRTFMHVDDCTRGIDLIMRGDDHTPFNLGPPELVTIDQLANVIEEVAGVKLKHIYNLQKPAGANIRHIDCSKFKNTFQWEPQIKIREGIPGLYKWVSKILNK